MDRWDDDVMAQLGRVAADATALGASLEVLRQRYSDDATVERAGRASIRLIRTVQALMEHLKR